MNLKLSVLGLYVGLSFCEIQLQAAENEYSLQQLFNAIRAKDICFVEKVITKRAQFAQATDEIFLDTPLHYAANFGNKEIVKVLFKQGINIDVKNMCENTPLYCAANSGNQEVVILLLEYGADINSQNMSGDTPLHRAVNFGNQEIVKKLLQYGADFTKKNYKNKSALNLAIEEDKKAIVKILEDWEWVLSRKNVKMAERYKEKK